MFGVTESIQYSKVTAGADTSKLSVLDLVSQDLNSYLDQGNDRQKRLNFLSRKLEIHKKTLLRISMKQNSPSYPTIMKLYRFFYSLDCDSKVLEKVPLVIKEFLVKSFPEQATGNIDISEKGLKFISGNVVALEVFLLASSHAINKAELQSKFGEYGITIIRQLIEFQLVAEIGPDQYTQGAKNISLPPELLVKAGTILSETYAKPANCYVLSKNFVGFYAEALSEAAYQEWIKIDQQAMKQKIEVAQKANSKGNIPAFSYCIIETLKNEDG